MFKVASASAITLLAVLCASSGSIALEPQSAEATGAADINLRPLNRNEGAALRDFTLAQPVDLEPKPDCSHLMHQIFSAAGLEYPYSNSFELYKGVPQFRRVRTPQPGDLIVWRGHVGLVVDPKGRTFYSSLGSGIQTDQYDNRYWRRRGPPRFLRYLTAGSDKSALLTARIKLPEPARTTAGEQFATKAEPAPVTDPQEAPLSGVLVGATARSPEESTRVPSSIPIVTTSLTPTREEVAQAISELTNASGAFLRKPNFSQLSSTVVIFDELQVEKVKIKQDEGWAEVRVKTRFELAQDKVKKKSGSEKFRWDLRRNGHGWQAMAPWGRVYVPADVSVQVMAEKLALLSRDHKEQRAEQAKLARLLNTVLNQD